MAKSTTLESLYRFCSAVVAAYGPTALRRPNKEDLKTILGKSSSQGWPGCLGLVDCMHWTWKNCPSGWAGMFTGKEGTPTVVLEATADSNCRFWHFFFGMPGSLNDLNVLDRSSLLTDAVKHKAADVHYNVNGTEYFVPYWLGDGIYPNYHCFIKSVSSPKTAKEKLFSSMQESRRKDIERAFGILQARFRILTAPCRLWCRDAMYTVMKTCVILHNMVIDYEMANRLDQGYINNPELAPTLPFTSNQEPSLEKSFTVLPSERISGLTTEETITELAKIRCSTKHAQLTADLIEHLWSWAGRQE